MDKQIAPEGPGLIAVRVNLSGCGSTRHYFASEHLWAALHNSRLCRECETQLENVRAIDIKHRSYATATILSAVAFLEALVNETFADAEDSRHNSARIAALPPEVQSGMTQFLADDSQAKLFEKFDAALRIAGATPMERGLSPYQDANALVILRNALVHFSPGWHDDFSRSKVERVLRYRFPRNSLLPHGDGSPWPIWVLGAGCAEWAYQTCRAFADEWTSRLGIARPYVHDIETWEALFSGEEEAERSGS